MESITSLIYIACLAFFLDFGRFIRKERIAISIVNLIIIISIIVTSISIALEKNTFLEN